MQKEVGMKKVLILLGALLALHSTSRGNYEKFLQRPFEPAKSERLSDIRERIDLEINIQFNHVEYAEILGTEDIVEGVAFQIGRYWQQSPIEGFQEVELRPVTWTIVDKHRGIKIFGKWRVYFVPNEIRVFTGCYLVRYEENFLQSYYYSYYK